MLVMWYWPLKAPVPFNSTLWPVIEPILVPLRENVIFTIPTYSYFLLMLLLFNQDHFESLFTRISYPKNPKNVFFTSIETEADTNTV